MNRSTLLLVLVLIALGAIVLFLLPGEKEHEASYTKETVKVAVDSASVVRIEIRRPGTRLAIENIGGRWTITSPAKHAADPSAVKQLLSGLAKFSIGSLISTNAEKQPVFQVDSTGALLTVTERSGKSTSLIIGKMGPSFSEVYFRLPDSKDVYLGQGIDAWSVTKDAKEWRDKTVLTIPSERITGLSYQSGERQYAYSRDSAGWKLNATAVEQGTLTGALNSLAGLKADEVLDSAVALTHPITLKISGPEGASLHFAPASADSSRYYVQMEGNPSTFVLSKWTAQQILKPAAGPGAAAASVAAAPEKPAPQQVAEQKAPAKPPVRQAVTTTAPAKKTVASVPPRSTPSFRKPAPKETAPATKPEPVVTKPVVKNQAAEEKPAESKTVQSAAKTTTGTPAMKRPSSKPVTAKQTEKAPETKPSTAAAPAPATTTTGAQDDEGDLMVHTVAKGETMTTISKKYNVTVEQILKWNLLKSISVKPGQELYIYQRTSK